MDGVAIGKRSAVEAELKLPFAGQAIPPATCDRKEEHGQEQQQQVLQPPRGGTGICVFVFVHFILLLLINMHPVIPGLTRDRMLH